ncbi:hypothetical protein [Aquitalea pelogenes]|uniref:hypothetical protein n=1 Tax=Aquitalea pelogenes TaxID=1293573 RepID=UPI0035B23121
MATPHKSIAGQKFGLLTAIRQTGRVFSSGGTPRAVWLFQCDCGKLVEKKRDGVTAGKTLSCGCLRPGVQPGKRDLSRLAEQNRAFVPESMRGLAGTVIGEKHTKGRSFGYAPSFGVCSSEYV